MSLYIMKKINKHQKEMNDFRCIYGKNKNKLFTKET